MSVGYLVPVLNCQKYVLEALKPVVSALGQDDRIYVQDGGSTDGTLALIKSMHEERIEIQSHKDFGQADALNQALERCKTEWVAWLNADDLAYPSALKVVHEILVTTEADLVLAAYAVTDELGNSVREFNPEHVTLSSLLFTPRRPFSGSFWIRRSLLERVGGFNKDLHYCMDYDLFLRVWSASPVVEYTPVLASALRLHSLSKTGSSPWRFVAEARRVRRPYLNTDIAKLRGGIETCVHATLVASTRIRNSNLYRRLRHGYRPTK